MKKLTTIASAAVLAAAAGQASATVYDLTSSFNVLAVAWNIPFTVNSGTYDDVTGLGSWNITSDLDAGGVPGGAGVITFDQTFTLDAGTLSGTFNVPTNCLGPTGSCIGLGENFFGPTTMAAAPFDGQTASWTVSTAFGGITFAPTLTAVPVPAAAWLFGSALVGLAGIGRRRSA